MSNGYLYVAYGDVHRNEARESARQLKRTAPNSEITVVCDEEIDNSIFDQTIIPDWNPSRLAGKVAALSEEYYDNTIFLDTDTYVVEDPSPLFSLVENYDVCIAPDPAEIEHPQYGFVPYNTGVMVIRNSHKTQNLFRTLRTYYNDFGEEFISYHPSKYKTDQPYFMLALADTGCNVLALDTTWNARYRFHTSFTGKVKIIHGPVPKGGWESLEADLNQTHDNRSWSPEKYR